MWWMGLAAGAFAVEPASIEAPAPATADPAAAALIAELMAMPDHDTRLALLAAKLSTSPDAASTARVGAALAALAKLSQAGIIEESTTRKELEAALLSASVRTEPAMTPAATPEAGPSAEAGTGTLCFQMLGRFSLIINDRPASSIKQGYLGVAHVPAGDVEIRVQGETTWSATVSVENGETLYFRASPTIGMGLAPVRVESVDKSERFFQKRCPDARVVFQQ